MMHPWVRKASENPAARPASALLSVAAHAVLIGAAVVATATDVGRVLVPEVNVIARFLAPPDRAGASAQREVARFVAMGPAGALATGDAIKPLEELKPEPEKVAGADELDALLRPRLDGQDSVFTELEVDSAATRYAWSAAPAYPPSMLEAKREGYVKAQWVVDESGYADTASFELVDYTSTEFAKAVRDALPFMRFSPAKFGNRRVRQLVQQEFTFRITSPLPDPNRKPPESNEF